MFKVIFRMLIVKLKMSIKLEDKNAPRNNK